MLKFFICFVFRPRGLERYHQETTLKAFAHFVKLLIRFAFFIFSSILQVIFFSIRKLFFSMKVRFIIFCFFLLFYVVHQNLSSFSIKLSLHLVLFLTSSIRFIKIEMCYVKWNIKYCF